MPSLKKQEFKDVFPKLSAPFVYAGGAEFSSTSLPIVNGTLVTPKEDALYLEVYAEGKKTEEFCTKFPSLSQVTSGFNAGEFAGKLDDYKTIFATQCPNFGTMTHEVGEYGDYFRTSTNIKIISCGVANGYFDLVVTHSAGQVSTGINAVNYSSKSSSYWRHSGDTQCHGNLVHTATFQNASGLTRDTLGHCVIVGYQNKPLHSWYGKSTGLFVIDEETQKTRFVPLDLAETTVAKNTVIVPLMYRAVANGEDGYAIDWWIPSQMATGMGDTGDVHRKPIVTDAHLRFEPPEPRTRPTAASSATAGGETPTTMHDPSNEANMATTTRTPADAVDPTVDSVFSNSGAVQLVCDSSQVAKPPAEAGVNTLFWNRGLSIEDKNAAVKVKEDRVVLPFVFPGEMMMCKPALLFQAGDEFLNPQKVAATLRNRRIVVHVNGSQNIDSSFLGARKALIPAAESDTAAGSVQRLNGVFIVHIKNKEQMNLANLSLVSMFAGPKATVVFQTEDTKNYFAYWGTPSSVIPCSMSNEVNPEWPEFVGLLEDYLICAVSDDANQLVTVPSHGTGSEAEMASMRTFKVSLGPLAKSEASFSDLKEALEGHRESDYETKESIVHHLFALEFILGKDDMEKVKKMVRSTFKSALSSKERISFFNNIKNLDRTDRDKIKKSAKLIDRLANRLCCRKFVAVNEFLAQFQEKLAGHGQKGAQKMELGMECLKFCESGDPSALFETDRDFMLVAVDTEAVQQAVIAAAGTSKEHKIRLLRDAKKKKGAAATTTSTTTAGGEEDSRLVAQLDPRTPELDNVTVNSLLALGIPHELEAQGAIQFAVPIQDEDEYYGEGSDTTKSLVFLPIFDKICPDLTQFDYTVWAYVLCEGLKNSCLVPRDVKTKPRQVEYAVLKLLSSFMKTLCDQRKAPVDPDSDDVNDSLVKKIRSVYWLIRAVMLKNVGIMTPEPICTIFDGKANHVFEIEIAMEVLPLICKTGLGPQFTEKLIPSVTEVFVRSLYSPIEGVFKNLLAQYKALAAEEHKAANDFFKGATITDSGHCSARIRSKKCGKCFELKTAHEFPRIKMLIVDPTAPKGFKYHFFNDDQLKNCLVCNGLPERPTLRCPCKGCKQTVTGSIFQFTSRQDNFATSHQCMKVPSTLVRRVPPRYCPEMGLENKSLSAAAGGKAEEAKIRIACPDGGPLAVAGGAEVGTPRFSGSALKELPLSTTEAITFPQFVLLATRLGLLTPTDSFSELTNPQAEGVKPKPADLQQLQKEIGGILALMLNNFKAVPAWKEIVPNVVAGEHKVGGTGVKLLPILEAYHKE